MADQSKMVKIRSKPEMAKNLPPWKYVLAGGNYR
jgi:hypothetical protein